jgi:N-acetylglutamate synthase-like GNAT family acetyltransferase
MNVQINADGNFPDDVERLLRGLPMWFGIEQSLLDYVESSRTLPTTTAVLDGEIVAVCVLRHHNPLASEIDLLAVRHDLHRRGIGKRMLERVEADLRAAGVKLLQVKTFGPSGDSAEYERTRAFYRASGFIPLEENTAIWGPANPCLILVKPLG